MSAPEHRISVAAVDLEGLILARNDVHPDGDWWFDPRTGAALYYGLDDDADVPELRAGIHILVPRAPQPREDLGDFIAHAAALGLEDDVVADLAAALRGRGGPRRFRAAVARGPAAPRWATFTVARESIRALAWLVDRGVVDQAAADACRETLAADACWND